MHFCTLQSCNTKFYSVTSILGITNSVCPCVHETLNSASSNPGTQVGRASLAPSSVIHFLCKIYSSSFSIWRNNRGMREGISLFRFCGRWNLSLVLSNQMDRNGNHSESQQNPEAIVNAESSVTDHSIQNFRSLFAQYSSSTFFLHLTSAERLVFT